MYNGTVHMDHVYVNEHATITMIILINAHMQTCKPPHNPIRYTPYTCTRMVIMATYAHKCTCTHCMFLDVDHPELAGYIFKD